MITTKIPKYIIFIIAVILCAIPFRGFIEDSFLFFSQRLAVGGPHAYKERIRELKKENLNLKVQFRRLQQLRDENERLRKALQFKEEHNTELVEAEVISFNPSSWRKVVNVNIGKRRGVRAGMLAVDENGYFIGKLADVRNACSRLILAGDADSSTPVFVGESSYGLLRGSLKGVKVLYVEAEDKIEAGQKIWIKSSALSFPVYVGLVRKASKDSEGLFWDIDVELFAVNSLRGEIFILK